MITIHDMKSLIRDHAVLSEISEETAELLAGCAHNVAFEDNEILLKEGEPADRFFLVRAGRVALQTATPHRPSIVIQTINEGEAVGLSWLVAPYRVDFTAKAVGRVRAIEFDAACMRGKCDADPMVGYELYKCLLPSLVERLHTARIQALDVYAPRTRDVVS